MNQLVAMSQNWWTTIVGLAGALVIYLTGVGTKFPETRAEWNTFVYGLIVAILGFVAKDATTGSTPGGGSK